MDIQYQDNNLYQLRVDGRWMDNCYRKATANWNGYVMHGFISQDSVIFFSDAKVDAFEIKGQVTA